MKPHLPQWIGRRKKDNEKNGLGRSGCDLVRTALGLGTTIILAVLLCLHLLPDKVSLGLHDTALEDIRAHRTVMYVDSVETARLRKAAAASVPAYYRIDRQAPEQAIGESDDIFQAVRQTKTSHLLNGPDAKARYVRSLLHSEVSESTLKTLVTAPERDLKSMQELAEQVVRQEYANDIRDDVKELSKARSDLTVQVQRLLGNTTQAAALVEVASSVLKPNKVLDKRAMARFTRDAERAVEVAKGQIVVGAMIIRKGETVTQTHLDKFKALGLSRPKIDYTTACALALFVALLILLVTIYLRFYEPEIYGDPRKLGLLSLVVILSMLGLKLGGGMMGLNFNGVQLGYLGMMTVTTAGMLLSVLLNTQTAVLMVSLLSIASGLTMNNELRFAAMTLVSSLVAIYSVSNIRDRADLGRTAGVIALTDMALVWTVGSMSGDSMVEMLTGSLWALVMSIIATGFFYAGTGVLERPFGITTHLTLLELSDTNKPLLQRLVMEAPGTYTHSMATGHLAEAAATAVHADSLFARVASYYHDIGKIRRPHFFVENQGVENAHDRLSPTLSSLVITSHIKDGLEIAREYKLPQAFHEVILQHHGTSLVTYFYSQVAESEECTPALERQFRYSGPKPQSKEAAIVMLADVVEAASRSLAKPTPVRLESLVQKVIDEKVRDGQLAQSDLTFRDIARVEDSFVKTLSSTLHARIEYPDVFTADEKRLASNGDSDTERAEPAGESEPPAADRAKIGAG